MNVSELIDQVLQSIARDFYGLQPGHTLSAGGEGQGEVASPSDLRKFMRDRTALMKAVARYGYTCTQRGWSFEVPHILKEVMEVLISMRDKQASIKWLPRYLEGAIDRHIRQRAEELSALAKVKDRQNVTKKVEGLAKVEAIREPSPTEILSTLYKDLNSRRRRKESLTKKPQQKDLF